MDNFHSNPTIFSDDAIEEMPILNNFSWNEYCTVQESRYRSIQVSQKALIDENQGLKVEIKNLHAKMDTLISLVQQQGSSSAPTATIPVTVQEPMTKKQKTSEEVPQILLDFDEVSGLVFKKQTIEKSLYKWFELHALKSYDKKKAKQVKISGTNMCNVSRMKNLENIIRNGVLVTEVQKRIFNIFNKTLHNNLDLWSINLINVIEEACKCLKQLLCEKSIMKETDNLTRSRLHSSNAVLMNHYNITK